MDFLPVVHVLPTEMIRVNIRLVVPWRCLGPTPCTRAPVLQTLKFEILERECEMKISQATAYSTNTPESYEPNTLNTEY